MEIKLTINDTDIKTLNNNVVDIEHWCKKAVEGQINFCWNEMRSEWTTKLMNDDSFTDPIPSNKTDFVNLVTTRSDYKTAQQRNEEAESQQPVTEEESE